MARGTSLISQKPLNDSEEFVSLSWKILEAKYIYYVLNGSHKQSLPDANYDIMAKRYDELAEGLQKEPTATNMVGFDETRPSCRLAMEKLGIKKE